MPPAHSKLQRWTDLIAALLVRRLGVTFDELAHDVPAYAEGLDPARKESVKRTFERDKDELREFGVPIEKLDPDDNDETRYRLKPADFYLPYLALASSETTARTPAGEGYRTLPTTTLTPHDLSLVGEAVVRLQQLGNPLLSEDARSAGNKLAFDLPLFDHLGADLKLLDAGEGADPKVFEALGDALRRRKRVSFLYEKPGSKGVTERHVEPYGLLFLNANWYLVARDRTRDALRSFRLGRMSQPTVNKQKPRTPDYEVPASFSLRDHGARDAWDLGDADPVHADVRFTATTGATAAAMRIGREVAGQPSMRRFPVRRLETFARWLLSLGGDAQPVSPPELVALFDRAVRQTLLLYGTESRQR